MVRGESMCDPATPKGIRNLAYVFHGCLSTDFVKAPMYTTGLLPHLPTDKRTTLKWWIVATSGERDRAGKDKSD
jgi:hypothetical protein